MSKCKRLFPEPLRVIPRHRLSNMIPRLSNFNHFSPQSPVVDVHRSTRYGNCGSARSHPEVSTGSERKRMEISWSTVKRKTPPFRKVAADAGRINDLASFLLFFSFNGRVMRQITPSIKNACRARWGGLTNNVCFPSLLYRHAAAPLLRSREQCEHRWIY